MAHRTTLEEEHPVRAAKVPKKPGGSSFTKVGADEDRERVFDAFRRWGYLEATLDPLGFLEPQKRPELDGLAGEAAHINATLPSHLLIDRIRLKQLALFRGKPWQRLSRLIE